MIGWVRQKLRNAAWKLDRRFALSAREQLHREVKQLLPSVTCVDVGASYYPHGPWELFRRSRSTHWLAVEPNAQNAGYVANWSWESRARVAPIGLSEHGGDQVLYVTNVDSGSSLLPPEISENMAHRIADQAYFFPVTPKTINTVSLSDVLQSDPPLPAPTVLKLDTQGSELSILRGAQAQFDQRRFVGVESEATLLADPVMAGSGKFWQLCQFMEQNGFELLQIKPIEAPHRYPGRKLRGRTHLNECDAVFALKRDEVLKLDTDRMLALFGFYLCYDLYEEAAALFDAIPGIDQLCARASVDAKSVRSLLTT